MKCPYPRKGVRAKRWGKSGCKVEKGAKVRLNGHRPAPYLTNKLAIRRKWQPAQLSGRVSVWEVSEIGGTWLSSVATDITSSIIKKEMNARGAHLRGCRIWYEGGSTVRVWRISPLSTTLQTSTQIFIRQSAQAVNIQTSLLHCNRGPYGTLLVAFDGQSVRFGVWLSIHATVPTIWARLRHHILLRSDGNFKWNLYGVVFPLYLGEMSIAAVWDVAMGVIGWSECGKREGREERHTSLWMRTRNLSDNGITVGQRLPIQSLWEVGTSMLRKGIRVFPTVPTNKSVRCWTDLLFFTESSSALLCHLIENNNTVQVQNNEYLWRYMVMSEIERCKRRYLRLAGRPRRWQAWTRWPP